MSDRKIAISSLIVGVLSLVATVFFGLRSEGVGLGKWPFGFETICIALSAVISVGSFFVTVWFFERNKHKPLTFSDGTFEVIATYVDNGIVSINIKNISNDEVNADIKVAKNEDNDIKYFSPYVNRHPSNFSLKPDESTIRKIKRNFHFGRFDVYIEGKAANSNNDLELVITI